MSFVRIRTSHVSEKDLLFPIRVSKTDPSTSDDFNINEAGAEFTKIDEGTDLFDMDNSSIKVDFTTSSRGSKNEDDSTSPRVSVLTNHEESTKADGQVIIVPNPFWNDYKRLFLPKQLRGEIRPRDEPKCPDLRDKWKEDVDLDFLDEVELIPSDNERESNTCDYSLVEFERTFFKLVAEKLRKHRVILNSKLTQWSTKVRLRSTLKQKSKRADVRTIIKGLKKCHKAAKRCFNFQRYSYVVCTESEAGSSTESFSLMVDGVVKEFRFNVNRYSTVNSMCLWDFASVWGGNSNFLAATDASPYLCLAPEQWKLALKADSIGRYIMMYEPLSARSLRTQGNDATERAEQLEEIHHTSKLFKLLLTEYIYMNRAVLENGMSFKGRDVIKALEKNKEKAKLFSAIPEWVVEFKLLNFILNPHDSTNNWQQLIPEDDNYGGDKERFSKKTIFLCDPIFWTMCLETLMTERVQALIALLSKCPKFTRHELCEFEANEEMKNIQVLAKRQISELRNIRDLLPERRKLEEYTEQRTRFFRPRPTRIQRGPCFDYEVLCHEDEVEFDRLDRERAFPAVFDPPPDLGVCSSSDERESNDQNRSSAKLINSGLKLMLNKQSSNAKLPLSFRTKGTKRSDKPNCSYLTYQDLECVRLALSGVPQGEPTKSISPHRQSCLSIIIHSSEKLKLKETGSQPNLKELPKRHFLNRMHLSLREVASHPTPNFPSTQTPIEYFDRQI